MQSLRKWIALAAAMLLGVAVGTTTLAQQPPMPMPPAQPGMPGGMQMPGPMGGPTMGPGMRREGRPMMGMMGGPGGAIRHVEGKLAFLKTEIAITEAQMPQWNAFADAMRETIRAMNDMHGAMMAPAAAPPGPVPLPERLNQSEKAMAAHLDSLRRLKAALEPLYGVLSDGQRKTADEVFFAAMRMM
ncbi:MAG: Spy/CpxP family protein refolding chaperone [Proteobacteria bacterium]|nr:Spy/CpxP family protein refolding chaperone [Pseudomonadota bacterium]